MQRDQRERGPKCKHWCFTINNPTFGCLELKEFMDSCSEVDYCVFQLEIGDSGIEHVQGYVEFVNRKRSTAVHALSFMARAAIFKRRGTRQEARLYCMKEEGRVDGPYESGEWIDVAQGRRTDLANAMGLISAGASVATAAREYPTVYARYHRGMEKYRKIMLASIEREEPEVILLYGEPGVGKTRFVRDAEEADDLWTEPIGKAGWFDEYDGQEAVLFDDFDGRMSKIPLRDTLRLLDRYVELVPVKGTFARWIPKRVYVTTNYHPLLWYDWISRFKQYGALERRFSRVIWWRGGELATCIKGEPEWKKFWEKDPLAFQCNCFGAVHCSQAMCDLFK